MNRVPEARLGQGPVCGRCKRPLDTSGNPQSVDAAELASAVAAAPVPVLVDFWAAWCGPCRMASPIVDRIARRRSGAMVVLKVDSDSNPEASSKHRIQGIPAFLFFRNGKEAGRQVGLLPEATFERWVDGLSAA